MSTKEISETIPNDRLTEALKEFDLAIYGVENFFSLSIADNNAGCRNRSIQIRF
ncbi:MAG: hypothetical protein IPH28_08110 [Cytophagaceae bacterium]|nr:hypothetical protein [Cytophagaceae bacterium]